MEAGLPLMKSVLIPLAKSVLILIGSSAGMSAVNTDNQKKMYGSGRLLDLASPATALIISNEEVEDIMKIVKLLAKSELLIKAISETIKNEAKEKKSRFLPMLLAASILGNALIGQGVIRAGEGVGGRNSRSKCLIPLHRLTNFEIQKYYQNEPKFNGVYLRNNLSKIKDWLYIINLNEYESIVTDCTALYVNAGNVTHFDSFGAEHLPKGIRLFIGNNNIITNIYRIQAYDSIICGYFCIRFIDFMLKGKSFLEYPQFFS